MNKKWSLQQMMLGKNIVICKRIKLDLYLTSFTIMYWKLIKDLNVRPETVKLSRENIGTKAL